ncbi:MAG: hypothetical protein ACYCQJ_12800 [Nitrososphaerales archaeon]
MKNHSEPVLVTLDTGGYECNVTSKKVKGISREVGSIAIHCSVAHILGEADVRILKPPKGYPPLVNQRNIAKVLEHESLHHAMQSAIFEDSNEDTLDKLIASLPDFHPVKVRLAFAVGS